MSLEIETIFVALAEDLKRVYIKYENDSVSTVCKNAINISDFRNINHHFGKLFYLNKFFNKS